MAGMYQEMVEDLQKKQRLECKNSEKDNRIRNLLNDGQSMESMFKGARKGWSLLLGCWVVLGCWACIGYATNWRIVFTF